MPGRMNVELSGWYCRGPIINCHGVVRKRLVMPFKEIFPISSKNMLKTIEIKILMHRNKN